MDLRKSSASTLGTVLTIVLICSLSVFGLPQSTLQDVPLNGAIRATVLEGVLTEVRRSYVFPDRASEMVAAINDRQARKQYDSIASARQFAETLTSHLQEISHDKHLSVVFSPSVLPSMDGASRDALAEQRERDRWLFSKTNFGFEKLEFMAANVGYLDLRTFVHPDLGGNTTAAAMNFLSNSDALVIDLRANRGGDSEGVVLLASYLVDSEPKHLNDMYDRRSDEVRQFWTLPFVPGKRLEGIDVFLLTSRRTFSAAEDFAYALQALGRVTIVGETTAGGAHPTTSYRLHDHFYINVPWGRSVNSKTRTNWEGIGVSPDIEVPADKALPAALLISLERRLSAATEPMLIERLRSGIDRIKTQMDGK